MAEERTKPVNCTCDYPSVIARNMNGHDTNCPVYIEWALKHLAGFFPSEDSNERKCPTCGQHLPPINT